MPHHERQQVRTVPAAHNTIAPYDLSQRPSSGETVKQPMNPFLLWCKTKRGELLKTQQGARPCDISKQLGELWRNMSEEDKKPFVDEATALKLEHQKNHPDFKRKHKKQKAKIPVVYEAPARQTSAPKTSTTSAFVPPAVQAQQFFPALATPTTSVSGFTAQFIPHGYEYNLIQSPPTSSAPSVPSSTASGTTAGAPVTSASNLPFFF